jgi:hypothetical protein
MTGEWEIHIHDRGGAKAKRCQVMKDFDETRAAVSAFKKIGSGEILRVHVSAKVTDEQRRELIANGATLIF